MADIHGRLSLPWTKTHGAIPAHNLRRAGPIILALGLILLTGRPASALTRFFIGVGASQGLTDEEPLKWVISDARRVKDLLVKLGGLHEERAQILENPNPDTLRLALARLQGNVEEAIRQGERTEVIFHYAGHGDRESLHLGSRRVPLQALKIQLQQIPAHALVAIFDACRTATRARGLTLGPTFDSPLVREIAPDGSVFIFAAAAGEIAQESDELEGAFFTHALLAGLRGAADVNHDQRVSLAEAWTYAHARTLAATHGAARPQHPDMALNLTGQGELVLTELYRAEATLVLTPSIEGDVLVLDARTGRVLLEVYKPARSTLELALPAHRIGIQVSRGIQHQTLRGEVSLDWGGMRRIERSDLREAPRLASVARGAGDVDLTPTWIFAAGGAFVSPHGTPGGLVSLGFEVRIATLPLFVGATLDGGIGTRDNLRWRFRHATGALRATLCGEIYLEAARLFAGVEFGATVIHQQGHRRHKSRLEAVFGPVADLEGTALAPSLGLRLGLMLPLLKDLNGLLMFRGSGAYLGMGSPSGSGTGGSHKLIPRAEALVGLAKEI